MAQKNWNIITVILAIAVLALVVFQFTGKNGMAKTNGTGGMRIAYVVADSINKHYHFITEMQTELETEAATAEKIMQRNLSKIEKRFKELQKEAKYMTPSQKQEAQQELSGMEQKAEILRSELQNDLAIKEAELQEQFYSSIQEFLGAYNEKAGYDYILSYNLGGQILTANPELDITEEVIDALNAAYRDKKAEETAATDEEVKK